MTHQPFDLPADDVLAAAIKLVGRSGATGLAIGYSDEHTPPVWFAVARYGDQHEAAGAMTPRQAVLRLLDELVDGGLCLHCHRPTGVTVDHGPQSLPEVVCWYQYDPERKTFRRSCE